MAVRPAAVWARRFGFADPLMLVRVFTLGFDPVTKRFDDRPLRDFISDKQVDAIADNFFLQDGRPYLGQVARYLPH